MTFKRNSRGHTIQEITDDFCLTFHNNYGSIWAAVV